MKQTILIWILLFSQNIYGSSSLLPFWERHIAERGSSLASATSKFKLQSLGRWKYQIHMGSVLKTAERSGPGWAKHTLNHKQIQSHGADMKTTSVLKILLPTEVLFWTESRGVSTLQDWAPRMTCSLAQVWIQTRWRQGNCLTVNGHLIPPSALELGPLMAAIFLGFVAWMWTMMEVEISTHFYYFHLLTKISSYKFHNIIALLQSTVSSLLCRSSLMHNPSYLFLSSLLGDWYKITVH